MGSSHLGSGRGGFVEQGNRFETPTIFFVRQHAVLFRPRADKIVCPRDHPAEWGIQPEGWWGQNP
jgi:hypothetical protein